MRFSLRNSGVAGGVADLRITLSSEAGVQSRVGKSCVAITSSAELGQGHLGLSLMALTGAGGLAVPFQG